MTLERRRFSGGVAWMAAGGWIEQAVNFAVFVVLARLLGAEAFGLLAMAAALVLMSEVLVRESVAEFLIAHAAPDAAHLDAAFWLLAALGLALGAVLALAAPAVAAFYGEPALRPVATLLPATVPLIALTAVPVAILRREMRFRALALRAVLGVILGGAAGVAAALAGLGVWALVVQRLVQVGTNVALAWVAVGWRPGLRASAVAFREVGHFGGQMIGLRSAELAMVQVPVIALGAGLGPGPLGLFVLAWRVVETASFLIATPLRMAAQPAFAALNRAGGGAAALLQDLARLTGMLAFPAFLGLSALARPFLAVVFGPDWQPGAPVLAVLALAGAYLCLVKIQQAYCIAAGRAGAVTLVAWAEVALAMALVGAVLALAPLATPPGTVAAWVAAGFVASFYALWPVRLRVLARISGLAAADLGLCHLAPAAAALAMVAGILVTLRGAAALCGAAAGDAVQLALGIIAGLAIFAALAILVLPDRLRLIASFATRRDAGP